MLLRRSIQICQPTSPPLLTSMVLAGRYTKRISHVLLSSPPQLDSYSTHRVPALCIFLNFFGPSTLCLHTPEYDSLPITASYPQFTNDHRHQHAARRKRCVRRPTAGPRSGRHPPRKPPVENAFRGSCLTGCRLRAEPWPSLETRSPSKTWFAPSFRPST